MRIIRLLTIGNSFADNALTYLNDLADSTGLVHFEIGRANLGGCSLEKHWNLSRYTEKHPDYKTYQLEINPDDISRRFSLQDALSTAPWDYVTLQQVSHKSWRKSTFQPHLSLLHDLVKQLAPKADILLHQTWAYRSDSPFLPQNSLTQDLMSKRIHDVYAHYAAKLDCGVLPSGEAVQQFRHTEERNFSWPELDFNYQNAEAPSLPQQKNSLAVGWKWAINNSAEGIPEMQLDANHLNAHGCYLTGCVWFECLTGLDVHSTSFVPEEINPDTALLLQNIAHNIVHQYISV